MSDAAPSPWVRAGLEAVTLHDQATKKRAHAKRWPAWHRRRRSLMREARALDAAFLDASREMTRLLVDAAIEEGRP